MDLPTAINAVVRGVDLTGEEMSAVMRTIMQGNATPAQIGGFLIALRMKGETVDELTAAAEVMRGLSSKVDAAGDHLVDTCGTGGDGADTFNISTTAAFVAAAAGARVAKHGNRSVSSRSGSADVLEAAGVRLDLSPAQVKHCIDRVGLGFMFAPNHHGAMKYAVGPRRELGTRTIFNLLGPLTNPAGAPYQVIGVFDEQWLTPVAQTLQHLGSRHVLVVHADDGLDEISIGAPTQIAELRNGGITRYRISPEDFAIDASPVDAITVAGVEESLRVMQEILDGKAGPGHNIVALNAGAAIYVSGLADSLQSGCARAREVIASGMARQKLTQLIAFTQSL